MQVLFNFQIRAIHSLRVVLLCTRTSPSHFTVHRVRVWFTHSSVWRGAVLYIIGVATTLLLTISDESTKCEPSVSHNLGSLSASEKYVDLYPFCAADPLTCPPIITLSIMTGQSSSCSGLDQLISNVNTSQLSQCRKRDDCSRVECQNQNGQLRRIVEVFDFRLLPCAEPSPVLWLRLLGQRDPIRNNQRSVQLSANLTGSIQHEVRLGGLPLGVYNFTVAISQPSSSVGIEVSYTQTCSCCLGH